MGDTIQTKNINRTDFIWYFIGIVIRIVWTIGYPQQGYIHPVRKQSIDRLIF